MIDLIYDFETRIRILSKSLREQVDKKEVIKSVKRQYDNAETMELDGRTNIESFKFDEATEEFLVQGRKGPSTWIGKHTAELFPSKRVHLSWLSLDWKTGSIIYTYENHELLEEIKRNHT